MKVAYTPTYGTPSILELREVPVPSVGESDVLIQMHASPVTEGDRRLRSADFPGMTALPGRLAMGMTGPRNAIQGTMFAGEVVEVGSAVTRYAVGDQVFGAADHSAYAEYLCVSDEGPMAKMPAGMSFEEAAAIPYGAGTALYFLRDLAQLKAGETVLVLGASGGVGRYAVQMAKHYGAKVTAVCSTSGLDLVRKLGADEVIDYRSEDFANNGKRYDVIFDIAGATTFPKARKSLSDSGRYLTLYMSFSALFHMATTALFGGRRAMFGLAMPAREHMDELAELMARQVLTTTVAESFPLARIADAHAAAERPHHGEIIVSMRPPVSLRAVG